MLYSNISPERSYWMGADGFTWWVGQVQGDGAKKLNKDLSVSKGPVDETKSNRVKVRIIGYHSSKWDELPVEDLPWAQVMMPANFPQTSGMGTSHQLHLGSYVLGFFLDGLNCQQPIIMGVIGDIATGDLKKLKPGNVVTDNPEQPGFNNIISPQADNTNQSANTFGWAAPPNISGPNQGVVFGLGNFDITTGSGSTTYNVGAPSYRDLEMYKSKEKQLSLASPCGTETQEKIDQTLGDLFRFLKGIRKINDQYVNKYTGEVVDFVSKINGFVGRISGVVGDILGSIKTLIIKEIRTAVRTFLLPLIQPFFAEALIPARELSDQLLNLIICLVDNILESILQFIENLILNLIENVINAAFCLVQSFINSLLSSISQAIGAALQAIQGIVSIIGNGGDLLANLASNLADFLGSLCGGFKCEVDASRYDMKTGELQPRSLFGSSDAIVNTDFLNNVEAPKIFDSQGNPVQGSLNCSQDNLSDLACPPKIALLGLNGSAGVPSIIPVVDNLGRLISTVIEDPGFNITSFTSAIVTSCNGYGNGAKVRPIITFETGGTGGAPGGGGGGGTNLTAPTIILNVSSCNISSGEKVTLTWNSSNVNAIVNSNFGATTLSGSLEISPTTTTTYTITVSGPGGTASSSIIVNVDEVPTQAIVGFGTTIAPSVSGPRQILPSTTSINLRTFLPCLPSPTIYLNASPNPVVIGASSELTWEVRDAEKIVSSNFGATELSGSITVYPKETTTYTLIATGRGGTSTSSITLVVNQKTGGIVSDVIIENPGIGYFNDNGNVIPADSPKFVGTIIGFNVTNVGSGYDENTIILVNGANCGIPTISSGTITSVTNKCNTTVTSYPDIEIIGTGTGAKIIPIIKYTPVQEVPPAVPIEQIDCPGHPQGN